jgi:hypothetical protein
MFFSTLLRTSFDDTVAFVLVQEMDKMGAIAWGARVEGEAGSLVAVVWVVA